MRGKDKDPQNVAQPLALWLKGEQPALEIRG